MVSTVTAIQRRFHSRACTHSMPFQVDTTIIADQMIAPAKGEITHSETPTRPAMNATPSVMPTRSAARGVRSSLTGSRASSAAIRGA